MRLFLLHNLYKQTAESFKFIFGIEHSVMLCGLVKKTLFYAKNPSFCKYTGLLSKELVYQPSFYFAKDVKKKVEAPEEEEEEDVPIPELKDIVIPRHKVDVRFSRSSGPGGQAVNTTSTKAEIRFNLNNCDWITEKAKAYIRETYKTYLTTSGDFVMTNQEGRDQHRNLEEAFKKLQKIVWEASIPQKERQFKIEPETENLERRRIQSKRKRSDVKKMRQGKWD